MSFTKQSIDARSKIYGNYIMTAEQLVSEGRFVRLEMNSGFTRYCDQKTGYVFAGLNQPQKVYEDLQRMKLLIKGREYNYKLPNEGPPHQSLAEKFEEWFEAQEYKDIRFQDGYIKSNAHHELFERLKNTKQLPAAQKQIEKFLEQVNEYTKVVEPLAEAGFIIHEQKGQNHLKHTAHDIDVVVPPNPKNAIVAAQKAMKLYEAGIEQENRKQIEAAKVAALITKGIPIKHTNGQIRSGPYVIPNNSMLDQAKQVISRGFALHNKPYQGQPMELDENSRVLVLDAGILHRCFGNVTNDNEISARFGEKIFDALLNDARFDAIIIPDYIADIEVSGVQISHDNGYTEVNRIRDKNKQGGEYYSPRLQELLQHCVRRHVDTAGKVEYLKDSEVDNQAVNPKIMIWETDYGKAKLKEFRHQCQNLPSGRMGDQYFQKPGEGFGEMVIEELLKEPELKACKKMVLSTDIRYLRGDFMDLTVSDKICRSNLGHYLHALIRKDLQGWSDICEVEHSDKSAIKLDDAILNIRRRMHTLLNNAVGNQHAAEYLTPIQICDNRSLFKEMTGLDPMDHMQQPDTHRERIKQRRESPAASNLRD